MVPEEIYRQEEFMMKMKQALGDQNVLERLKQEGFDIKLLDTAKISEIQKQSPHQKHLSIKQSLMLSHASFIKDGMQKNSSFRTMASLVNCMIGAATLVLPLQFEESGVITSILALVLIAAVSCKTCHLLLLHSRKNEDDLPLIMERIVGRNWFYIYNFTSGVLLALVAMIYYLLITNMLYSIITFFLSKSDFANKDAFTFGKLSFQYATLISVVLALFLASLQNLNFIIKMSKYGFISQVVYFIFLIYIFIDNLTREKKQNADVKLLSTKFGHLGGTFSLYFMVHNVSIPIFHQNKHQSKNHRDLNFTFLIATCMYIMIGTFGYFGILGRGIEGITKNTVMDYFPSNAFAFIIQFIFIGQLSTSFPLCLYISRIQIIQIWSEIKPIPKKFFYSFNFLFLSCCVALGLTNTSPTIVIAYAGGICGFLIIYLIPVMLHLTILYGKPVNNETLLSSGQSAHFKKQANLMVEDNEPKLLSNDNENDTQQIQQNINENNNLNQSDQYEYTLNSNQPAHEKKSLIADRSESRDLKETLLKESKLKEQKLSSVNKNMRYAFYAIIMLFGLSLTIIQILDSAHLMQ